MITEDRKLLFKDLCIRLPYNVKIKLEYWYDGQYVTRVFSLNEIDIRFLENCCTEGLSTSMGYTDMVVKPYLRPLSSITDEEKEELRKLSVTVSYNGNDEIIGVQVNTFDKMNICVDFLNSHHFDYRGLIEKGLAIAVTDKDNPYK